MLSTGRSQPASSGTSITLMPRARDETLYITKVGAVVTMVAVGAFSRGRSRAVTRRAMTSSEPQPAMTSSGRQPVRAAIASRSSTIRASG